MNWSKIIKQLREDIPLYINGFCNGYLLVSKEVGVIEIVLFVLSPISLAWIIHNVKNKKYENT